jgi:5-methylcytosine-specific restriction protein A
VYEDDHWETANTGKALYVDVNLDALLDPTGKKGILSLAALEAISTSQNWTPQSSGTAIEDTVAAALESEWTRFLDAERAAHPPEEVRGSASLYEGATRQITVNAYERDPEARKLCIDHYGLSCCVCSFHFEAVYGEAGKNFIHVHHLKPLAEVRKRYIVDPIQELRPVCPNCHAMIHRRKPIYTIEEMKELLAERLDRQTPRSPQDDGGSGWSAP